MVNNYSNTTLNSNSSFASESSPSLSVIWSVLIMNLLLIVNYSVVAFVLTKHTKTFAGSYYVITRALAFCDMVILIICMGYTTSRLGPADKRPKILTMLYYVDFGLGFFPSQFLNVIIGSNRFVAIVFFDKYKTVFTEYRSRILICGAFLLSISVDVIYFNTALWDYSDFVYIGTTGFILVLIAILYTVCVCISIIRIKNMSISTRSNFVTEIKLLVQAILVGFLLFLQELLFHVTNGGISYDAVYTLYAGLNPFIYLSFNSKLRELYASTVLPKFLKKKSATVNPGATTTPAAGAPTKIPSSASVAAGK